MTARLFLALLAALVLPLTACDEGVDPTVGTDQVFTVWGYLDPTADQQAIRVVPIGNQIGTDSPGAIDANVTVTDQASGEAIAFRDSLVTFPNGSSGHVFIADWTPGFDRTYRVEVKRSADGKTATATIETPPAVAPVVGAPNSTIDEVIYPITFGTAPNVFAAELRLFVGGTPTDPADTLIVQLPAIRGTNTTALQVPFVTTVRRFLTDEGVVNTLQLVGVELLAFVADAGWDVASGRFDDLDRVIEPGTISNVDGGFGFVGGGYFARATWLPSSATQVRAGFLSPGDPGSQIKINEVSVSEGWVELYNPLQEAIAIGGYHISDDPLDLRKQTIPNPRTIAGGGFFVVELDFPITEMSSLIVSNAVPRQVVQRNVEPVEPGTTYGSYPDGMTFIDRDLGDLMGGALIPTRGAPNRPDVQPAVLNELFTAGTDGWVEVATREEPTTYLEYVGVRSTTRQFLSGPEIGSDPRGYLVLEEDGRQLDLNQQEGEVFLLASYRQGPGGEGPVRWRVVDYIRYGIQTPSASTGRIPDTDGPWATGLVPTRGAPNAASRPF